MASVNKQSVRDEVQKVKVEFDRLSQTGSMSAEVKALMNTLLLIVELMLSIFLEKTVITPVSPRLKRIRMRPHRLTQAADDIVIFDSFSLLQGAGDEIKPDYSRDLLHLNQSGYDLLNEKLGALLHGMK